MNSQEKQPKKLGKDYNLFIFNKLTQIKENIDIAKKEIINLQNSLDDMRLNVEKYQNLWNLQKESSNENIIERKEKFLELMENNINTIDEFINKINKKKDEIKNKIDDLPNLNFNPPNINSFNQSNPEILNEELNNNNNSNELYDVYDDEENKSYSNFYNDNSKNNISNSINNKKKSIFSKLIENEKSNNNNNINNNNVINKFKNCLIKNNIQKKEEEEKNNYQNEFDRNEIERIENSFISDDCCFEENEKEYDNFCKNFYFVIHLIKKKKSNKPIEKTPFFEMIIKKINIKKNNIFFSLENKNSFTEIFIKTEMFSSSSIKEIKINYPDFNKLYEYKEIYDNILNDKKYLDYKGNTINPNSSYNLKRGTELYDPPYGWLGIGLKVNEYGDKDWLNNKTNTSKWAIAYYGIGQFLPYNQVKETLNKIILNMNLKISNKFKDYKDKRHPNNTVGEGICLSPKINFAENYSGITLINGKKYKVVLMAKVLIEKIREIYDIEFWILNKDDIRFYRILLKEVN